MRRTRQNAKIRAAVFWAAARYLHFPFNGRRIHAHVFRLRFQDAVYSLCDMVIIAAVNITLSFVAFLLRKRAPNDSAKLFTTAVYHPYSH